MKEKLFAIGVPFTVIGSIAIGLTSFEHTVILPSKILLVIVAPIASYLNDTLSTQTLDSFV